jgi:hypothetical protein
MHPTVSQSVSPCSKQVNGYAAEPGELPIGLAPACKESEAEGETDQLCPSVGRRCISLRDTARLSPTVLQPAGEVNIL